MSKCPITIVTFSKKIIVTEEKLREHFTEEGFEELTYKEMVKSYVEYSMLEYLECHTGYNALNDMDITKQVINK